MITILSLILIIIGGINWFSVGVFDFNIIDRIFPGGAYIGARIVYALVGVAALWSLVYLCYNKFSAKRINAMEIRDKNHDVEKNKVTMDGVVEVKDVTIK